MRKPGAGRKRKTEQDPTLLKDLKALVDPSTRGDPMGPLLWTTRSLRNLVKELSKLRHKVSRTVVGELLHDLGYSLQANSKTKEGSQHIDRDTQFQYINDQAVDFHLPRKAVTSAAAPAAARGALRGPGDRKSVQPMAERLAPGDYDQLHPFVAAGLWDAAPLEGTARSSGQARRRQRCSAGNR